MDPIGFTTGFMLGSSGDSYQETQTCECVCPDKPPREPMAREDVLTAIGVACICIAALFIFNRWMNSGIEK